MSTSKMDSYNAKVWGFGGQNQCYAAVTVGQPIQLVESGATPMQIGIPFPQNEIGTDPIAIRDFAQEVESKGFDYLGAYEHVAGAHPDRFVESAPPQYLYDDEFHETFTLFSYLAAVTTTLQFTTTVMVLPQRQTTLVAKQAAELDLLSQGRFRLGIGVGWNHAEYESMGAEFQTRGRRQEEQIHVLRLLWNEPLVTFDGRWHHLDRVAIAPRPLRPIPIWLGGGINEPVMRRAARLADGWMPLVPIANAPAAVEKMTQYLEEEGRDFSSLGLQASIYTGAGSPSDWINTAATWRSLGATHLGIGYGPHLSAKESLKIALDARQMLAEAVGI